MTSARFSVGMMVICAGLFGFTANQGNAGACPLAMLNYKNIDCPSCGGSIMVPECQGVSGRECNPLVNFIPCNCRDEEVGQGGYGAGCSNPPSRG
jgi:hypothetical protein